MKSGDDMTRRALAEGPATAFPLGTVIRQIVDGLLRGLCRGQFLCSTCLVKVTRDHLDHNYATRDIAQAMEDIFSVPGPFGRAPTTTCAACARRMIPCLGMPAP